MSPDLSNMLDGNYDDDNERSFDSSSAFEDDLDFDQMRQQSERSESIYGDMETMDEGADAGARGGSRFSLGNFTPGQRLILVLLVLLDIVAIGFGVLVVMGIFSL